MRNSLRWIGVIALGLLSCRQQQTIVVPNRVLERPLDVVLVCVQRDGESVTELALNQCADRGVQDCEDEGVPQLVGFVANSDTNEVGMFRRCDINGMVDLDPEAPGYNLVPVGALPSKIVDTPDCRVVTANAGSCDLTAIQLLGLASYAVGLAPEGAPSSLVSTIVPLRGNGEPLGARPGDMIALPPRLSLVGGASADDPSGAGVCDPDSFASVLVTFPSCHLVAEINLATHRILQSRQFVTDANGLTQVIDPGPDPLCPVECPGQFDGEAPEPLDVVDGVFPVALALVDPGRDDTTTGQEAGGPYPSFYVGGTGSDEIFEIELEVPPGTASTSGFAPAEQTRRLRLEDPQGVSAIRITPEVAFSGDLGGATHQFLYVIAGDGSTHVVERARDRASLGVECDTQLDPSEASAGICAPIDAGSAAQARRRPFAAGPGIRATGAVITDWVFQRSTSKDERSRAPFRQEGVVGIGTTSGGRVVLGLFDQYGTANPTLATDPGTQDPTGLMNVALGPHMLWPVSDPHGGDPRVLPLVTDEEPDRLLPSDDQATQVLAPAVRRIDLAYFAAEGDGQYSEDQLAIWRRLGRPDNVDGLGDFDGNSLYERTVARVAVRDYRQWRSSQGWSLAWEMEIPGTRSQTGRLTCAEASEFGQGSCAAGARIIDEGATFCDEGVLPGDKLLVGGCGADDDCGLGQRCLRDPSSGGGATGICVSAMAYGENLEALREYCKPFISDPCGTVSREYLVTDVKQTEVTLEPLDIGAVTFLRERCPVPAGPDNLRDPLGGKPVPPPDPPDPPDDGESPSLVECEARLTCAVPDGVEARSGGCIEDLDCAGLGGTTGAEYVCFDGQCRTPCEGGSRNCRQRVLPGPGCFGEFLTYTLALRDSFAVSIDPTPQFIADRVRTESDGTCREDETQSNLLTSRLWLGADEDDTFSKILDCPNAAEVAPSDPNPCRIVTRREDDPESLFHSFAYDGERVEAIRFSNPYGTLVIDLVSLRDLGVETDLLTDSSTAWPPEFARFRRARIPRSYRENFSTPSLAGYQTFNDPIVVSNTPLTYPIRVVAAPEEGAAYVVDAGGRGGSAGVRGQVVRILVTDAEIRGDEQFLVQ